MASEITLNAGDIQYLPFYLKEKDETTGSITYYDITLASSIQFRMRKYNATANTLDVAMSIVTGTLGYCRCLATIPAVGKYYSEIEVYGTTEHLTWKGPVMIIEEALG